MSHSLHKKNNIMCNQIWECNVQETVIPHFIDQIKNNNPVTITDPLMTRFMMDMMMLDLVLYAFKNSKGGEIFIKSKSS